MVSGQVVVDINQHSVFFQQFISLTQYSADVIQRQLEIGRVREGVVRLSQNSSEKRIIQRDVSLYQ